MCVCSGMDALGHFVFQCIISELNSRENPEKPEDSEKNHKESIWERAAASSVCVDSPDKIYNKRVIETLSLNLLDQGVNDIPYGCTL